MLLSIFNLQGEQITIIHASNKYGQFGQSNAICTNFVKIRISTSRIFSDAVDFMSL